MQIFGDQLIIGDNWRAYYSLNKNTGKKNWTLDKWINAQASAFSYKDNIYLLNSGTILQINQSNGKILLEKEIKSNIGGEEHGYNFNVGSIPIVEGNIAYIGTNNKGVIALNMDDLSVKWECHTGDNMIYATPYSGKGSQGIQSTVVIKDDKIYFGAMDGNLYVVDKNTGNKIDTFKIGSSILSKAILGNSESQEFIIVSDFEGWVTRINLNADGTFVKQII